MQDSNRFWITGLVPATFTPLHADGSLNLAVVEPMVDHLTRDRVTGLYVCGSTGEGVWLTAKSAWRRPKPLLLPRAGAHGAVGSTYNFAAPLYNRILAAFAARDMPTAQRLQARAVELVNVLIRHGANAVIKAVMAFLDLDCGPVRLPQVALTAEQEQVLRQELDAIGFFRWGRSPD